MPRLHRIDVGGEIYHVLNRATGKKTIFEKPKDYLLFIELLDECIQLKRMNVLAYCIMPNHWHLVCKTRKDGDMGKWIQWLTQRHVQNWHVAHDTVGTGHLYQGRYKSIPVQTNEYLLQLIRYVEQNPLRAHLVQNALDWKWGSLWRREKGTVNEKNILEPLPIDLPRDYTTWVNDLDDQYEIESIRKHTARNVPYGEEGWFSLKETDATDASI